MTSALRYWLMISVLLGATGGLHLAPRGEAPSLVRPLSSFPSTLNGMQGRDVALEKWQISVLEIDDYLSRIYSRPSTSPVVLYIGYYRSQRQGQIVHTPKNCLPGSGWEPLISSRIQLDLSDGRRAPVNFYIIEKGLDRQVVIYWYQAHGRIIASEYWGKLYTILDAIRINRTDAAVIRISTPIYNDDEQGAGQRILAFAQETVLQMENLIPR
jgi:EpsI family protein